MSETEKMSPPEPAPERRELTAEELAQLERDGFFEWAGVDRSKFEPFVDKGWLVWRRRTR